MKASTLTIILLFVLITQVAAQSLEPCRNDDGLFGYCDKQGKVVIPHKYYDALEFNDGHAAVLPLDKWGIINEAGNWMVQPKYDEVINCKNVPDQILVKADGKWSFINAYGVQLSREYEVRSPWYEFELDGQVAQFQPEAWFAVSRKDKWGLVDIHDNVKLPLNYQWARAIRREVGGKRRVVSVVVKDKDKYAWQKADEETVSLTNFDQFMGEYANFLFFREGNKSTIINAITGERVINSDRNYFNLIDDEDSAGLVNTIGKIIIPFKYHVVDVSKVQMHALFGFLGQLGLSDLNGNVLLKNEYQDIRELSSSPALISVKNQEGKVAIMAIDGPQVRPLTEFKYDYAIMEGDKIKVKMGSQMGAVSVTGVETWQ